MDYSKFLTNLHYQSDKKIRKDAKKNGYNVDYLSRGVAHYSKDGKHIVSIKGTNPLNLKDLASDFGIAVGLTNKDGQFRGRKKELKKIYKKIPKEDEIQLTGHSLGGSIGTSIMAKSKSIRKRTDKADFFNTGYTKALHKELRLDLKPEDRKELNEKITHHVIDGDIVSQG